MHLEMQPFTYFEGMSVRAFVHSRDHTFVNPEGHRGRDQSQGQVGHHRNDGDILGGQEDDKDRSKGNSRIPRILPVNKLLPDLRS
jgi:hypothetical protein